MIRAYRQLKERILSCKTDSEKFMAIIEIADQLDAY